MDSNTAVVRSADSALATNKLIRNTYTLLSLTLIFSALMAGVSMLVMLPPFASLICSLGAMALMWFVLPRTADSASGLGVVFAITGLLGFGLGPVLSFYLGLPNGGQIVMSALGLTGLVFMGLSAYALTSRKDFSFMGGFLVAGIWVAFLAGIATLGASALGYPMPGMAIAVSVMFAVLMAGYILYQTSLMVNGGETNYIIATVGLYVSIYNMFVSLLHLIGVFSGDD